MKSKRNTNEAELWYGELYELYADSIFRFCIMKTSDRNTAIDLTQEVYLKMWEYVARNTHIEYPRALLYKIANNLVVDHYRKKKSDSLDELKESGFDLGGDDHIDQYTKTDSSFAISAISKLEPKYRDVLLFKYVEDMPIKEIALITGESPNNISVRIHRALGLLQDELEK